MIIVLIVVGIVVLMALVLRFIQPELIYGFRQALITVRTNKVFLDQEAGRPHADRTFLDLILTDLRYETRYYDERYVLQRITKVRELSRMLDSKRNGLAKGSVPRDGICIIELSNMLKNLGENLIPGLQYAGATVDASTLLAFIGNRMREKEGLGQFKKEREVEEWFSTHPVSIDQTVEILIAAAFALAYRQRWLKSSSAASLSSRALDHWPAIIKVEKRLRWLVRREYDKARDGASLVHQRIEEVLGSKEYHACVQRMRQSRSDGSLSADFFDFLYMKQISKLLFAEWDMSQQIFDDKEWLNVRIEKIIHIRNETVHLRYVSNEEGKLASEYCAGIERKIDEYLKRIRDPPF